MTVGGGMVAAGHPADRGGRRARAARRRQRGRRGGRRRARLVGLRAAAHRPRGRRVHARRRRRRARRAAGLLRRGARRRSGARRARGAAAGRDLVRRRRPGLQLRRRLVRRCRGARPGSTPRRAAGAACRWPTSPRPPPRSRATACRSTPSRPTSSRSSTGSSCSTPEARAEFAPGGRPLREGEPFRSAELAETIERLGADGAAPFYDGDLAAAIVAHVAAGGGQLGAADLARVRAGRARAGRARPTAGARSSRTRRRRPAACCWRSRSRGSGTRTAGPPTAVDARRGDGGRPGAAHQRVHRRASSNPGFLERFLAANLGSTTHVSVLDGDGRACAVTCTNGASSGVVVPGTGIHLNNIMGEEDLNPRRVLPRAAGTADAVDDGADGRRSVPAATSSSSLGSAGSNRIRSAILQVVVNVVDRGMAAGAAIDAPRLHAEGGRALRRARHRRRRARGRGARGRRSSARRTCSSAARRPSSATAVTGVLSGGGDPRRGGCAVAA